ncbi:MAG: hypothetical protein ACSLEL_03840 [Candidatus Malihini olakiniferum]
MKNLKNIGLSYQEEATVDFQINISNGHPYLQCAGQSATETVRKRSAVTIVSKNKVDEQG